MIAGEVLRQVKNASEIRRLWELSFQLQQEHGAENVADMTLGNPLQPPPAALQQALAEVVARPPEGLHRYTPTAGHPEVRERIAEHLVRRDLLPGTRREHVVVTAGAAAAANVFLHAVLDPGDEVIVLAPHFPDYPSYARSRQAKPVVVDTGADFLPDPEALSRAIGPHTRVVILNHPNNPSGRIYPLELLEELTELLRRRSWTYDRPIYLLSDEPYRELLFSDAEHSFVSPVRLYEHGVMVYSFSKSHSIPGERIGYLALNPAMPDSEELRTALSLCNRILGFVNAASLWQHVIARCLDALIDVAELQRHRDRMLAALQAKGYTVTPPEGAFYLFPETPGGDDDAFVSLLIRRLLLGVPGRTFGQTGHFRLAFCVDDRTIDLAAERLPEASEIEEVAAYFQG